jgi:hypothetical protein
LWFARWTTAASPTPLPGGWTTWAFWQFTNQATVPGIPGRVDLNRFCCTGTTLAALGGVGDAAAGNPFGTMDGASALPGTVRAGGWVIDPDTTGSLDVHVYVDGQGVGAYRADTSRPDVGAAYPGWGDRHGWEVTVPASPGRHEICVYAINQGVGTTNPLMGCRTVVGEPIGNLESAVSVEPGRIKATGWAIDPDTTAPADVHFYIDGRIAGAVPAGRDRPDIGAAYPSAGPNHGFDVSLPAREGFHQVCAYAINVGSGTTNPGLGCRGVWVQGADPVGTIDAAGVGTRSAFVSGWGFDPDADSSMPVRIWLDGRHVANAFTGLERIDVGAVYPRAGSNTGWRAELTGLSPGVHSLCAQAVNRNRGTLEPTIGCRTLDVPAGNPIGNLESATPGFGSARLSGWALDPDALGPVDVHIYVDGVGRGAFRAESPRTDVGAAYPFHGDLHGIDVNLTGLAPGTRRVCVYAINVGPGTTNPLVGCRQVVIDGDPIGNLEAVTVVPGGVQVSGWTLDPDRTGPIDVHVYAGSQPLGAVRANGDRADVAAAFPGYGPAHGFSATFAAPAGRWPVCAYAINVGVGVQNTTLGCFAP